MRDTRRITAILALAGLLGIQVWVWTQMCRPGLDINGDNAHYLMLGRALAQGEGYRVISDPGSPIERQYPFGWPAVLAVMYLVFGESLMAVKVLLLLMAMLSTVIAWRLWGWPAAAFAAASFHIGVWSGICMSEIPYMAASFVALWVISKGPGRWWSPAAVLAALMPISVRSIGVAMAVYFLSVCVMERRWKSLAVYAVAVAGFFSCKLFGTSQYMVPTGLNNFYNPDAGHVTIVDMIVRLWTNLVHYATLGPARVLMPWDIAHPIAGFVAFLFVIAGMVISVLKRDKKALLIIYIGCYMGAVMLWPSYWVGIRYLVPVMPILFYYAVLPLLRFQRVASALVVLVVAMQLYAVWLQRDVEMSRQWKEFYAASELCRRLPKDAVIMSRKPPMTWIMSGERKCMIYPFTNDRDAVWEAVKQADYVILDSFTWTGTTRRYLLPVILEHVSELRPYAKVGNTLILTKRKAAG